MTPFLVTWIVRAAQWAAPRLGLLFGRAASNPALRAKAGEVVKKTLTRKIGTLAAGTAVTSAVLVIGTKVYNAVTGEEIDPDSIPESAKVVEASPEEAAELLEQLFVLTPAVGAFHQDQEEPRRMSPTESMDAAWDAACGIERDREACNPREPDQVIRLQHEQI